jgi:hypothetical protein
MRRNHRSQRHRSPTFPCVRAEAFSPSPGAGYPLFMWSSTDTDGKIREGLIFLLSQGIIDDFQVRAGDDFPFRIQVPAGVVPMNEKQVRHFMLGAVAAHFGPIARARR